MQLLRLVENNTVLKNQVLYIEKLDNEVGTEVVFDKVLMVNGKVGTPYVKDAKSYC